MLLILALAAVAIPSVTFSLNYSGSQKNQATFETLEEARKSGPAGRCVIGGQHWENVQIPSRSGWIS